MILDEIKKRISEDDLIIKNLGNNFSLPPYDNKKYYKDIASSNYFYGLLVLRHYIKIVSDYYFSFQVKAKNVDLFMLTSSVSSPMGPGSDSEPIKISFGNLETFLVDSSQFGFEPLLLNNFNKVYCYLPSMRGEKPDERHLNQFFHCELEMKGELEDLIPVIEVYIKTLCEMILSMKNTISKISNDREKTVRILENVIDNKKFPEITFDQAIEILKENKLEKFINYTSHGRDINREGEIAITKILKLEVPVWIKYFDRDRVPFYQKPFKNNKVFNADLIFPPINNGFGGEVVGCGQRQNSANEMYESLKRQNVSSEPYEWYIDLRNFSNYEITSGFGMGIERFTAWALAINDIKNVIPYPRLKNIISFP